MQPINHTQAAQSFGFQSIGKSTDFLCPMCPDSNLSVCELHGTQVCGCGSCAGFLIDGASLSDLVIALRIDYRGKQDKPELLDSHELDQFIACPPCGNRMYTHPYHGPGNVVINSCSDCKLIWLDAGEFGKIIRAPGKRGG